MGRMTVDDDNDDGDEDKEGRGDDSVKSERARDWQALFARLRASMRETRRESERGGE